MGVGPVFSGSEKDNRDSIEMFGVYAVHIGERQNNDYCQRSQQDEEQEETKHPAKEQEENDLGRKANSRRRGPASTKPGLFFAFRSFSRHRPSRIAE